jgi:transcriptional antiterminator RfaH
LKNCNDNRKWYVFRVKRLQEQNLAALLSENGIEAFLPLIPKKRVYKSKTVNYQVPLLGGYIFVLCKNDEISIIRYTKGIVAPLLFNNEPAHITENEIELMKIAIGVFGKNIQIAGICKGEKVQIIHGAFVGYQGIVCNDNKTAYVLLNLGIPESYLQVKINKKYLELIP